MSVSIYYILGTLLEPGETGNQAEMILAPQSLWRRQRKMR